MTAYSKKEVTVSYYVLFNSNYGEPKSAPSTEFQNRSRWSTVLYLDLFAALLYVVKSMLACFVSCHQQRFTQLGAVCEVMWTWCF